MSALTEAADKLLEQTLKRNSDVTPEHLFRLHNMASKCSHVTEFGVRTGVSTMALLSGVAKSALRCRFLRAYDLVRLPAVDAIETAAADLNVDFLFKQENTTRTIIEPTELLFIDTTHTYVHLRTELYTHADNTRAWIAIHDTKLAGEVGFWRPGDEPGVDVYRPGIEKLTKVPTEGLNKAIEEFLSSGKFGSQWQKSFVSTHGNGLTVLERIS